MVPSLEERRRRFRHLAETHPSLVVASTLVEDVSANARAERRLASLSPKGHGKSGLSKRKILGNAVLTARLDADPVVRRESRGEGPVRKGPTQLQFTLWPQPQTER